jgi:hypothetical protein
MREPCTPDDDDDDDDVDDIGDDDARDNTARLGQCNAHKLYIIIITIYHHHNYLNCSN